MPARQSSTFLTTQEGIPFCPRAGVPVTDDQGRPAGKAVYGLRAADLLCPVNYHNTKLLEVLNMTASRSAFEDLEEEETGSRPSHIRTKCYR